ENLRTRLVPQPVNKGLGSDDEDSQAAERFAERPDTNESGRVGFEEFRETSYPRTEDARSVRFVDQEHGVVAHGEIDQFRDRRDVAIHAEHRIDDDQPTSPGESLVQFRLESLQAEMRDDVQPRSRE